jgi:tripeptidyl-peptidase-1
MFLTRFCAFLALSCSAVAFPAIGKHVLTVSEDREFTKSVREKLARPPQGWTKDESFTLDKDTSTLRLRIHLSHQDMDKFHELAMNV